MSVVTVVLQWDSLLDPTLASNRRAPLGWNVKVNGLKISERSDFRKYGGASQSWVEINRGSTINLLMTPRQQPEFETSYMARNPPVEFITDCLNGLAALGYNVVSSNPVTAHKNYPTTVWTLQQQKRA